MSSFTQHETTVRGHDSVIDMYLNSLYTLKEKVGMLLQNYHLTILQKMDCDLGNIVACNTDGFQSQLADVFTHLNEVEVQLNGLEAWAGLPPECFASTPVSHGVSSEIDQASHEAQALVELVHRLQATLRSMNSRSATCSSDSPGPVPWRVVSSQLKSGSSEQISRISSTNGLNNNAVEIEQNRHMEVLVTSKEYNPQPPVDELCSTSHVGRYALNSPGSIPTCFLPSPPTGDKRHTDSTDANRGLFRTNHTGSLPYPPVPVTYTQVALTSNPSPGLPGCYLPTDSRSQPHVTSSSKFTTSVYAEPSMSHASRAPFSNPPGQLTNQEPFGGPYN